ncbi:cytochrome P450 [Xylaria sp. FL1777]|nr:cytochrome P450 [Xylaria sp. FL1777]
MNALESHDLRSIGLRQTAGISLIAVILAVIIRRLLFAPLANIPGPWYTKWTNVVVKMKTIRGEGPIYVDQLHDKYGSVVRLGPDEVDVADIEATKKIHRVKADFIKTDFYLGIAYKKENILNTQDINFHRRHRKLLSQPLSENSLKAMEPQIEEKVRFTVERMGQEMRTRKAVDVYKWWMFMTTDIIGQLTFGESFHALENGKQIDTYIKDLRSVGFIITIASQLTFLMPILYHVPFPLPGFSDSLKTIAKRLTSYASTKLQKLRDEIESKDEGRPLLFSKLVQGTTIDGESLTDTEIRNDAEIYIIAGSDTSSNTLTYLTWALCKQPELRDQLVKELEKLPADFTADDLKYLPFLNQCITECLRLFPVVPGGLPRYVPKEGADIAGYWLPSGITVTTQAWTLHRNPEVFPNPDEYNPARWETPTKGMKDSMMAFGGGSRACIGMHLAYIELRMGLAYFFRAFPKSRVSGLEGMSNNDMKQAMHFISSPHNHRCLIEAA